VSAFMVTLCQLLFCIVAKQYSIFQAKYSIME
jgi:hypothetical protein